MKIGIHCFEYPPCNHGGIGSFTKDLAEGLVKAGHEVTVFGLYYSHVLDLENETIEKINGVKIYRYPYYDKFKNKRLNLFFSRVKLYEIIKKLDKEEEFDLIETPDNQGWLPLGLPNNIPMITRLHGGVAYFAVELNRKSSRIEQYLEKYQLQKSNHIVSVSEYTAKRTLDIFKMEKDYSVIYNSVLLPNGFDCRKIEKVKNLIVFSGSVLPKKGVEELVIAVNIVCKEIPDAKLVIAGKNILIKEGIKYENYLLSLIDDRFKKNISFIGSLNREKELFPLLCSASVCCFPSHAEAFSIAPLEAMALGKPVVYSILSSGKEALVHDESGLLSDPREPDSIAENLLKVLGDEEYAKKLAKNGKHRFDTLFNYDKWLNNNIELFEKYKKRSKQNENIIISRRMRNKT
jgi:glycosyltransferase involved in cell wall biosynthesis